MITLHYSMVISSCTSTLTYGGIIDIVIRGDHSQIERLHVHLVLYRDTLRLLEVVQRRLHQLRQVVWQMPEGHMKKKKLCVTIENKAVYVRRSQIKQFVCDGRK